MERALGDQQPKVKFFGVLRPNQKDILQQFEKIVYDSWDRSSAAPPQQRERSEADRPALSILAWLGTSPSFPDHLMRKFAEGTPQYNEMAKLQQELQTFWPAPAPVPGSGTTQVVARTAGSPDLAGASVLDLEREIDLAHISVVGFNVERWGAMVLHCN